MNNDSDINPHGNPDGKGAVAVLGDWQARRPKGLAPKTAQDLLSDFWISLLVLSANFGFRVVPGQVYSLYFGANGWMLSLVSDDEWRGRSPGEFVCECELKPDMTWRVVQMSSASLSAVVTEALTSAWEQFANRVAQAEDFDDALPEYLSELPYQQRMMATALSVSLRESNRMSGALTRGTWPAIAANLSQLKLSQFQPQE